MFRIFETAINSSHYFLLIWPAVYAMIFCKLLIKFEKPNIGNHHDIVSAVFSITFIAGLVLSSFLCSEPVVGGRSSIPGALGVFWFMTVVFSVIIFSLILAKRLLVRFATEIWQNKF